MKKMKIKLPEDGFIFFQDETSAQEYIIFQSNSLFLPQKRISKCLTSYISIAVYEEPSFYEMHKEQNMKDIHLPGIMRKTYRDLYSKVFYYYFKEGKGKNVKQIFLGHDHDLNGRCFIEICVFFNECFNDSISPGSFVVIGEIYPLFKENRFLFLIQKPKENAILEYFCKEEGDFFYLYDSIRDINYYLQGKEIQRKNEIKKDDIKKLNLNVNNNNNNNISSNNNLNSTSSNRRNNKADDYNEKKRERQLNIDEEKKNQSDNSINNTPKKSLYPKIIVKETETEEYELNNPNIQQNIKIKETVNIPEFKWIKNEPIFKKYPSVMNWFTKNSKDDCKYHKALLIYSDLPNMGKSQFAKSLVNNLDYAIIMTKKFKMPTEVKLPPKLLIIINLEEIGLDGNDFLNLISGKEFHISEEGIERLWNFKIPCVITTRSFDLVRGLYRNEIYSSKIVFIEVNDYIGIPGKQVKVLEEVEAWFTKRTWEFIRLKEPNYNGNRNIMINRKRTSENNDSEENEKSE